MRIISLHKDFVFGHNNKPTPSCHASTILPLEDGGALCAWFGGSAEGAADVKIWLSRLSHGKWFAPRVVSDDESIPHWNPVLFRREDGAVCLYYKLGHKIPEWRTKVAYSYDKGESFTQPVELVPGDIGGRGPVKNKPITLSDRTIAAPASIETSEYWRCFIDLSSDGGISWSQHWIPIPEAEEREGLRMIQPSLWQSPDGGVHCLMRSSKGRAYRSDSADGGRTWCPAYATGVPNNNSGLDLVGLRDGTVLLVSNPISGNWSKRTPLTLSMSCDGGVSFGHLLTLEDTEGEFSYPAICEKDGRLYISYTYKREQIAFVRVEYEPE